LLPKADKVTVGAALATMALIGLLGVIVALFFVEVKTANKDFLNIAIMTLVSCVSTGFGYFLGSSLGSAKKDELLLNSKPKVEPDKPKEP